MYVFAYGIHFIIEKWKKLNWALSFTKCFFPFYQDLKCLSPLGWTSFLWLWKRPGIAWKTRILHFKCKRYIIERLDWILCRTWVYFRNKLLITFRKLTSSCCLLWKMMFLASSEVIEPCLLKCLLSSGFVLSVLEMEHKPCWILGQGSTTQQSPQLPLQHFEDTSCREVKAIYNNFSIFRG